MFFKNLLVTTLLSVSLNLVVKASPLHTDAIQTRAKTDKSETRPLYLWITGWDTPNEAWDLVFGDLESSMSVRLYVRPIPIKKPGRISDGNPTPRDPLTFERVIGEFNIYKSDTKAQLADTRSVDLKAVAKFKSSKDGSSKNVISTLESLDNPLRKEVPASKEKGTSMYMVGAALDSLAKKGLLYESDGQTQLQSSPAKFVQCHSSRAFAVYGQSAAVTGKSTTGGVAGEASESATEEVNQGKGEVIEGQTAKKVDIKGKGRA